MRFSFIWRLQRFAKQTLAFALLAFTPIIAIANQAPPVLLANVLGQHTNPAAYLVSEKYDGVRAIWDGKTLRFRSGRTVNAPDWFLARLPAEKLDGELWLARDAFERLSGYVRKTSPLDEDWRQIKYMIFELPDGNVRSQIAPSEYRRLSATLNGHNLLRLNNLKLPIVPRSSASLMKLSKQVEKA